MRITHLARVLTILLAVSMLCACGSSGITIEADASADTSSSIYTFTYHSSSAFGMPFTATGGVLTAAGSIASQGATISTYAWEQISGAAVTITSGTTSETMTFDAPTIVALLNRGELYNWQVLSMSRNDAETVFRLTITDSKGNSSTATVTIWLQQSEAAGQIRFSQSNENVGVGVDTWLSGPTYKTTPFVHSTTPLTDWNWTLTPPAGSAAVFSDTGTVASTSQITSFIPDVAGTYTVAYTSASGGSAGTLTINAASFVGVGTIADTTPDTASGQCGSCHADKNTVWEATGHPGIFQQNVTSGSYDTRAPRPYCWECHTLGYDTTITADNGGFYSLVEAAGYEYPSEGTTWDEFVVDNPTLFPFTGVQCENCHGPGSAHLGVIVDSKIDNAPESGMCTSCHPQGVDWKISNHDSNGGEGAYIAYWSGNTGCVRCHSSGGFIQHVGGEELTAQLSKDYNVSCSACHDPHTHTLTSEGNDAHQLRLAGNITMLDDASTVVDAGKGAVCYMCHDGFYVKGELDCDSNGDGTADADCNTVDEVATQYFRQIHGNPQSPVLEGLMALTDMDGDATDDFELTENSFHGSRFFTLQVGTGDLEESDENDKCVTCHMSTSPEDTEEGYRLLGGHSWKMTNTNYAGTDIEFVAACQVCHAGLTTLNRTARADYDGDGTVEGMQDEFDGLALALTNKIFEIDPVNMGGGTTETDGVITPAAISFANQTAMNASPIPIRRAAFNHNLVVRSGDRGIHNTAFAVQVMQKTYTAISELYGGNSFATDFPNTVLR